MLGVLAGLALGLALMASAPAIVVYFVAPIVFAAIAGLIPGFEGTAEWLDLSGADLLRDSMSPEAWARLATGVALWIALPLAFGFARLRRKEIS